jgi:IS1 family transposase/transposase-like protein
MSLPGQRLAVRVFPQNQFAVRPPEENEFTIRLFEEGLFFTLKKELLFLAETRDHRKLRNAPEQFKKLIAFSMEHPKFSIECGIIVVVNHVVYSSKVLTELLNKSKSAINQFLSIAVGNLLTLRHRNFIISNHCPQILNRKQNQWVVRIITACHPEELLSSLNDIKLPIARRIAVEPPPCQLASYLTCFNFGTFYDNFRNLRDLGHLNFTDDETIAFLAQNQIIQTSQECNCGSEKEMLLQNCDNSSLGKRWYCSDCKSTKSIFEDSFFSGINTSLKDVLSIAYCFAQDFTINQTVDECRICRDTVIKILHRLQSCIIAKKAREHKKIGGHSHMVQMDETFVSKHKDNKGRKLCAYWIIGGIDTLTRKVFLEWDIDRDTLTLTDIIKRNIEIPSYITTDGWPAYNFLSDDPNIIHDVVIHKRDFVNKETGANTQMIERLWLEVKEMKHRRRGFYIDRLDELLAEFIWRRNDLSVAENKIEAVVEVMQFYMK